MSIKELFKESRDSTHYAEFLRERIYGTITLLAVTIGILLDVPHYSIQHAFIVILTTALGLWAASIFAEYISYRVVHDHYMPASEVRRIVIVHRGILVAAIPTLFMIALATLETLSLATALRTAIVLDIAAMTVTIIQSASTRHNTIITTLISIAVQAVLALIIVQLKLLAH